MLPLASQTILWVFTAALGIHLTQAQWTYQWQTEIGSRASDTWKKYVRSPSSDIVHPARVLSNYTLGNVTNPDGFLTGAGLTILTRPIGSYEKPTIVVDFGQNVVGYLSITFGGASNFTTGLPGIRLAFSETLQFLSDISDFSRSYNGQKITPGSDQIAVRPDPYTWTDEYGCELGKQVCADGLHGFRYMKVYLDALPDDLPLTSSSGEVSVDSISLNFTAFLGTPDSFTGYFESSDEDLNQWFYDSVYTNDLCTDTFRLNDTDPRNAGSPSLVGKLVLLDGPKRDRDPYVGDLAVASRTSYLTHNVPEASRNVLGDLADHQRDDGWIPPASINNYALPLLDYPLWWVTCNYDLFMYTSDTDFVTKYYQTMVKALDTFYPSITNHTTQLITKGLGVSGSYGDYAFLPRTGAVTYYNALYVIALQNAAFIAKSLGHNDDDARWTARAQNVSDAINQYRFDSATGAFFDGDCGSTPCATHAQDGNSLSIVSGAVNGTRAETVLSYLATHNSRPYGNAFYDNDVVGGGFSQRVYAYISYFELEARFISGQADSALEEIRRLYGWMASHDPEITVWEGIAANGVPYEDGFTSMSHGWSTGIVPVLMNYVLGVLPTGPGFSSWTIKPMPGDLEWASGVVPTPNGPISVDWKRDTATGWFYLRASAPAGSQGIISVPVSNSSVEVHVDSKVVWDGSSKGLSAKFSEGYISLWMIGGEHTITVGIRENS